MPLTISWSERHDQLQLRVRSENLPGNVVVGAASERQKLQGLLQLLNVNPDLLRIMHSSDMNRRFGRILWEVRVETRLSPRHEVVAFQTTGLIMGILSPQNLEGRKTQSRLVCSEVMR